MSNDIEMCKSEISHYFGRFGYNIKQTLSSRTDAKVYEVFCLQKLLKWIDNRYEVNIEFVPHSKIVKGRNAIILRESAGYVNRDDYSYFTISSSSSCGYEDVLLEVHLNIEILTRAIDNLGRGEIPRREHAFEIDVVVIDSSVPNHTRPMYTELVMGLECKLVKKFKKGIIAIAIGIRNAISSDAKQKRSFILDDILQVKPGKKSRFVQTVPKSEYWLVQTHDKAKKYIDLLRSGNVKLYMWRRKV